MKCKHCGFEPASEEEIVKILFEVDGTSLASSCEGKRQNYAKALIGKVGELVGKDNVDKKMDRLMEEHKKFCERMDKEKYMSVEEVEKVIQKSGLYIFANSNFTTEQVDCECKSLAQALTRLPKGENRLQKAVDEILNMAEIDSYIFKVHNKGKYSVEAKDGYNECIRDMKRIIKSHTDIAKTALEGGE